MISLTLQQLKFHFNIRQCLRTYSQTGSKKQILKTKKSKNKKTEYSLNSTDTEPLLQNSEKRSLIDESKHDEVPSSDGYRSIQQFSSTFKNIIGEKEAQPELTESVNPKNIAEQDVNSKINEPLEKSELSKYSQAIATKYLKYDVPTSFNLEKFKEIPLINVNKTDISFNEKDNDISSISIFEGGYKKKPSVRTILQETMSPHRKLVLEQWEKNMILRHGEEGFKLHRQGLMDTGQNFHGCIELKLRGEDVSEEQLVGIENYWKSLDGILPRVTIPKCLETRVIHPLLHYQGKIDCVGIYKNTLVVIDFKTSSKPKLTLSSTYDDPLQLVAYIGALNYDPLYQMPNVENALLIVAYSTGLPAHVHFVSKEKCEKYWLKWCSRVQDFWRN